MGTEIDIGGREVVARDHVTRLITWLIRWISVYKVAQMAAEELPDVVRDQTEPVSRLLFS